MSGKIGHFGVPSLNNQTIIQRGTWYQTPTRKRVDVDCFNHKLTNTKIRLSTETREKVALSIAYDFVEVLNLMNSWVRFPIA